ncbi:iron-siderophore ABC transporter substrate-binding protein [Amycolatopsis rhabdoformis]|uniref:Iron-siderophore ABC transporter substrate-binding protein n=1 Tax=Amycolatopsis rhabdoformis TaxID=1448059 RepID=A0ABZ1HX88_9PSEU|nr:iron-siderophore ABC transporter substrate-binding protein [Amycolatopsis rhabdoformis]WSE26570.1 iron-siderophore ABC transporter substrate-binding protein [Amycolatopsis rhabdoformis]
MARWTKVVGVLAAATLLGACSQPANTTTSGVGDKDVATGGRLFSTADTETAKLKADVGPGVFPRTVTHALGQTKIEKAPTRVIVLDSGELDDVLALGVTPVGMATTAGQTGVPSYLADRAKGIPTIGSTDNLNLEKIASLQPDLILGSKLRANDLYPQLSKIAPTVFSIRPGFPWKENLLLIGAALGQENKAVAALNAYQKKADEVKAGIKGNPKISLLRFHSTGIRIYGDLSFIGVIFKDVGLQRPDNQHITELAKQISRERIDEANGDWIFYSSYGAGPNADEKAVTGSGLWNGLSAVKAKQAIRVNDEVWFLGLGPIGADHVLDDLKKYLG